MARPTRWNEIVDAAASLFHQKGFVATSLEDIAGEVGMYKGSLYHYITSKEDLLTAVVREPADQILADVRDLAGQDLSSSEKVRRLTRSLLRVLEENREMRYTSTRSPVVTVRTSGRRWTASTCKPSSASSWRASGAASSPSGRAAPRPRADRLAAWLTRWYQPGGELTGTEIADHLCEPFLVGLLTRSD